MTTTTSGLSTSNERAGSTGSKSGGAPLRAARRGDIRDPGFQAYLVLRIGFVVAPVLFGIDKYFNWMTFWPKYLWIGFPNLLGVSPQHFMYGVGAVEILAGVLVLLLPRIASYVVAGWLGGIVTDLIVKSAVVGGHTAVYWDIALRDFGLMLATLALARLSAVYAPRRLSGYRRR